MMEIKKSFEEGIFALAKKYKSIVVLNSNSAQYFGLEQFAGFFQDRFFSLGLGEANMVSASVGFTVRGKVPFVTGFASFLTGRAWEQIRNDLCYPNLNVKLIGACAGLTAAQQGVGVQATQDIALMRTLPNMKVICPADYVEAASMLEAMMADYGPTYLRLSDGFLPNVYKNDYRFQFGVARVLREGNDICIFAIGPIVQNALEAAKLLEEKGVSVTVVNVPSIKPIDKKKIQECAASVKFCVSVEDHTVVGGFGDAVGEALEGKGRLVKIGLEDCFAESAKVENLYAKYGLDALAISEKVRELYESV